MLRKVAIGLMVVMLGSPAWSEPAAPAPRDVLAGKIKAAQDAKSCDAMIGLFYTQGMNRANKQAFNKAMHMYFCDHFDHHIDSIAFQSIPPENAKPLSTAETFTLTPAGAVVIAYSSHGPGDVHSISFRYGLKDDKAYLVTTKTVETK